MKLIVTLVIALFASVALASGKYDRERICPSTDTVHECDLRVENAVAKDVPCVMKRNGLVLRIRATNGKVVERKNAGPEVPEGGSWKLWACDYFPQYGYVRLCYRLWEWNQTEFVNINTGEVITMEGWPIYSPSRGSMLIVNGDDIEIHILEIWRFEKNRLLREFRLKSPPGEGWELAHWKNEREIETNPRASRPRYRLLKEAAGWALRGQ